LLGSRPRLVPIKLLGIRMSIRLLKYRSDRSRTGEPSDLVIVSSLVIGLLAGASGTYFFEHGFHKSGAVLFGIAGILVGGAINGWLNWSKIRSARRAHTNGNMPQSRSPWEYRPRQGTQRHALLGRAGAETIDTQSLTGPLSNIDESVWFDFPAASSPIRGNQPMNSLPQSPTTKVP
jgi:hypothetical protein